MIWCWQVLNRRCLDLRAVVALPYVFTLMSKELLVHKFRAVASKLAFICPPCLR